MPAHPADVVGYWRSAGPARWFTRNAGFDEAIRLKFEPVHHAAARGEYAAWEASAEGSLALLILLDQFPRNLYRDSGHAFATDPLARAIARKMIDAGFDLEIEPQLRPFAYLPFEHSEDPADQALSVALFEALAKAGGDEDALKWAVLHQEIITRFGRFPHRNDALGRTTSPEEAAFLADGGFAG